MQRTLILLTTWMAVVLGLNAIDGLNATDGAEPTPREQRLARYLSGAVFEGEFTIDGSDNSRKPERYEIKSCEKLSAPDRFKLVTRIKYGDIDSEVPIEIRVLFAGETPVITLDSLWIPGMGTFDARVLIRRDRYAGTWKHDDVGGHLFGRIVPKGRD